VVQAGPLLHTIAAHLLHVLRNRTAEAGISGPRRRRTIALRPPTAVAEDRPSIVAAGLLVVVDTLAVVAPQPLRQAAVQAAEAASTASPAIPTDAASCRLYSEIDAAFGRRSFLPI